MSDWVENNGRAETLPLGPETPLDWAVSRWKAEVKNRPLQNVHRRSLDDTWRQVIRYFNGDPDTLAGPSHDELLASNPIKPRIDPRDAEIAELRGLLEEANPFVYLIIGCGKAHEGWETRAKDLTARIAAKLEKGGAEG